MDYDYDYSEYVAWCEEAKEPVYEFGTFVGWMYPNGSFVPVDDDEDAENAENDD